MECMERICRRAALEIEDGQVVNLGLGLPQSVMEYIQSKDIVLQSESGGLMMKPLSDPGNWDSDLALNYRRGLAMLPGAAAFDLVTAYTMIRGGYVDISMLQALQVDASGNIGYLTQGRQGPGAHLDLAASAGRVIALLPHRDKHGASRIRHKCGLPLAAKGKQTMIITEQAVFQVNGQGLVLKEIAAGTSIEQLKSITHAPFILAANLCAYRLD